MVVGALALAQLSPLDADAAGVLPSPIGMGIGMGMIVSPALNTATTGVQSSDIDVASALLVLRR